MEARYDVPQSCDVLVAGSGAGGMTAALRAHDLGLSVVMVEKAHQYGGTAATSAGGTWIPLNDGVRDEDSVARAMTYLQHIVGEREGARDDLMRVYVENAWPMMRYLDGIGVRNVTIPGYPDYYSDAPGALASRGMGPCDMDGAELGDEFLRLRDHHPFLLAFRRYALNFEMAQSLSNRLPGWQWTALRMMGAYWLDMAWRRRTRQDRRLTMGRALVGMLRKAMLDRDIPLILDTALVDLERTDGRIGGALVERHGRRIRVALRRGVVLAAGGFEQNQAMRDRYMPVTTSTEASLAPKNGNKGEAILLGQKMGGMLEPMGRAWWCPSTRVPSRHEPNVDLTYPLFFDRTLPGSICVNRLGRRFANEAISYEQFGRAMIADEVATGANNPCWMVFDATFRRFHNAGWLLPNNVMPDRRVPENWWGSVIHRAPSIVELADQVGVDGDGLAATVASVNADARTGRDSVFGRGEREYDRFFGAHGRKLANPCFGPLDTAPYYAIRVELGDLGTSGGLSIDGNGAVQDEGGRSIPGLYALGNCAGSVFGDRYPGGGVTLGQGMIFGYLAAAHLAS